MTRVEFCEDKKHTKNFEELERGDYFWHDEILYIKVNFSDDNYKSNSVALESGEHTYFDNYDEVLPIKNIRICIKD